MRSLDHALSPESPIGLSPDMVVMSPPGAPLLLVEDDPLIRDVLLETLVGRGLDVLDVGTGEEAARLLADGLRPPVLVTDINLGPGCSGVDLADTVRARDASIPIVFITGRLDMLRDRGVRAREFILPKPFPLADFVDLVFRLVPSGRDTTGYAG